MPKSAEDSSADSNTLVRASSRPARDNNTLVRPASRSSHQAHPSHAPPRPPAAVKPASQPAAAEPTPPPRDHRKPSITPPTPPTKPPAPSPAAVQRGASGGGYSSASTTSAPDVPSRVRKHSASEPGQPAAPASRPRPPKPPPPNPDRTVRIKTNGVMPAPKVHMGAGLSKIFNGCPLNIHCATSWTHPETEDQYILFGCDEGLYYLNLELLHEEEMVRLLQRKISWLLITDNTLITLTGKKNPQAHWLGSLYGEI